MDMLPGLERRARQLVDAGKQAAAACLAEQPSHTAGLVRPPPHAPPAETAHRFPLLPPLPRLSPASRLTLPTNTCCTGSALLQLCRRKVPLAN